jgi:hypothetical protein
MSDAGQQPRRTLPWIGEAALRRDPDEGMGLSQDDLAGPEKRQSSAGRARFDSEEAEPLEELIFPEALCIDGSVVHVVRE